MKCRPNEFCFVIRSVFHENIGKVVKTICIVEPGVWEIEPEFDIMTAFGTLPARGFAYKCDDASLLPIRDPGPDAVDETLQIIGSPREGVAA